MIAVLAIAALAAFAVWEEWLNLIVGLWTLVSPWVLGFLGTTAMTVHVIIGVAVAILAAIELWMMSQIPPRLTAAAEALATPLAATPAGGLRGSSPGGLPVREQVLLI